MKNNNFRAKTREEIANEYQISSRTFRRWLDRVGLKLPRGLVFPKQQAKIYKEFGDPGHLQ